MDLCTVNRHSSFVLFIFLAVCTDIITGAALLEGCYANSDCPHNAVCRPKGCKMYICQCQMGYHEFDHAKGTCLKASLIAEPCSSTSHCLPVNSYCDNRTDTCLCKEGLTPSLDRFKCRNIGADRDPGDACNSTVTCDFYSHCVSGKCQCLPAFSAWTIEEKWLMYPRPNFLSCKTEGLSMYECNGDPVTMSSITNISGLASVTDSPPVTLPEVDSITPKEHSQDSVSTPPPEATAALEVHTLSPPPAIPVFITENP